MSDIKPPELMMDISNAPIEAGDWVIINDFVQGHRYQFEVVTVLPVQGTLRRFRFRVMESTHPSVEVGKVTIVPIDREQITQGAIIKKEDRNRRLSGADLNRAAATQLRQFLDSDPEGNGKCQVGFEIAVKYLYDINVFPADLETKKAKVKLRQICQEYKGLIKSTGGVVRSTGADFRHELPFDIPRNTKQYIEIDFQGVVTGLRMILQSISCIRLRNYGDD